MTPVWYPDSVTTDLHRGLHYTLLWGLNGIVVRRLGRAADRVPYVNERALKDALRAEDMPLAAVDPGLFEGGAEERVTWLNELALLEETLSLCNRLGCERVIVGALGRGETFSGGEARRALRQAGEKAAEAGCRLVVRPDTKGHIRTGVALADLVASVGHDAVGVLWAPAVSVAGGEPVGDGLAALAETVCIEMVEVDDAWLLDASGEGDVAPEGNFARLRETGFEGPVALSVTRRPVGAAGLEAATAMIRMLRRA